VQRVKIIIQLISTSCFCDAQASASGSHIVIKKAAQSCSNRSSIFPQRNHRKISQPFETHVQGHCVSCVKRSALRHPLSDDHPSYHRPQTPSVRAQAPRYSTNDPSRTRHSSWLPGGILLKRVFLAADPIPGGRMSIMVANPASTAHAV
jgi:hypothetical protein